MRAPVLFFLKVVFFFAAAAGFAGFLLAAVTFFLVPDLRGVDVAAAPRVAGLRGGVPDEELSPSLVAESQKRSSGDLASAPRM